MATVIQRVLEGVLYNIWPDGRIRPVIAGGAPTLDELKARQTEIRSRLQEIDTEFAGQAFPGDAKTEWNDLNEERDRNEKVIDELEARQARVDELSGVETNREAGAHFSTPRQRVSGNDIYDLSTVRSSVSNPAEAVVEMRDRAKTALERATFPHERANREVVQGHIEKLLERADQGGALSRHILETGGPTYARAFEKYISGRMLTTEEQRALSTTTTEGGFAVPFTLDPTIIPTSNHSVNPYRAISSVKTITTTKWEGVTSAGVTASYGAENTEATDGAPTLGQPTVTPIRADVFVPFSIEIGQDWGGLQSEVAVLIQDAKDDLEADRFTLGTATTTDVEGILVGGTALYTTAGTAAFVVADLYGLEQALKPRSRARASFVGNRFAYNKVRQFDTAGGASLYVDNLRGGLDNNVPTNGNVGQNLLNYPTYECSSYPASLAGGSKVLTLGDFSKFVIVDRIGLTVEYVPHLFGTANGYPTGTRGLFAYWRNATKVLDKTAFKTIATLS